MYNNIKKFSQEMTSNEQLGDGIDLTTFQQAKVVQFEVNDEKYFSICSTKKNSGKGEIDPAKTMNMSREEFTELMMALPTIHELLTAVDHDNEDDQTPEGDIYEGEDGNIQAFGLFIVDESGDDDVPDELVNAFCTESQANCRQMQDSAPDDDDEEGHNAPILIVKPVEIARPPRAAVLAKVVAQEIRACAIVKKKKLSPEIYEQCDRARIIALYQLAMRALQYVIPYRGRELLDMFTYMNCVQNLFTKAGVLQPNVVKCPLQDNLLLTAYEEALTYFPTSLKSKFN